MLRSIQGVYRSGKIELTEQPDNVHDDTPVIVTFLETGRINLSAHDIDESEAVELRARLTAFAKDWDAPEMDIYDNYESAKAKL